MVLHDVPDPGPGVGQEELPDGDHPHQDPVVGDIAGVDGLLVHALPADALEAVGDGGVRPEGDELRGHDGPGAVLGVVEELVDLLAGLGPGVAQDAGDHAGGHLLNDVHGVVQVELVQDLPELPVAERADEALLVLAVIQVGEDLGGQLLGEEAEDDGLLVRLQLPQEGGDVHLVHLREELPQGTKLLMFDQLRQALGTEVLVHGPRPLPSGWSDVPLLFSYYSLLFGFCLRNGDPPSGRQGYFAIIAESGAVDKPRVGKRQGTQLTT